MYGSGLSKPEPIGYSIEERITELADPNDAVDKI